MGDAMRCDASDACDPDDDVWIFAAPCDDDDDDGCPGYVMLMMLVIASRSPLWFGRVRGCSPSQRSPNKSRPHFNTIDPMHVKKSLGEKHQKWCNDKIENKVKREKKYSPTPPSPQIPTSPNNLLHPFVSLPVPSAHNYNAHTQ